MRITSTTTSGTLVAGANDFRRRLAEFVRDGRLEEATRQEIFVLASPAAVVTSAILGGLFLFASSHVTAQAVPSDRARQLLATAQAHYEGGRMALAADTYLELYQTLQETGSDRAPIALWNAGNALADVAGREREAVETLRRFLDESSALTEDADVRDWRSEAISLIQELEARLRDDDPTERTTTTALVSEPRCRDPRPLAA